jgi:hypothetical protein
MTWKGCGRKRSYPNYMYYIGIYMDGLKKPRETSVSVVSDVNGAASERFI